MLESPAGQAPTSLYTCTYRSTGKGPPGMAPRQRRLHQPALWTGSEFCSRNSRLIPVITTKNGALSCPRSVVSAPFCTVSSVVTDPQNCSIIPNALRRAQYLPAHPGRRDPDNGPQTAPGGDHQQAASARSNGPLDSMVPITWILAAYALF